LSMPSLTPRQCNAYGSYKDKKSSSPLYRPASSPNFFVSWVLLIQQLYLQNPFRIGDCPVLSGPGPGPTTAPCFVLPASTLVCCVALSNSLTSMSHLTSSHNLFLLSRGSLSANV